MKAEILYSQIPHKYPICLNRECIQADTCLRQLAENSIPTRVPYWTIINPRYLVSLEEEVCPFYRAAIKVRFAKGCIGMLENLPCKDIQTVTSHLIAYFNRSTYYRVRKGERLLSPSEQQGVLDILKKCGISHPREFDAYIEEYDW